MSVEKAGPALGHAPEQRPSPAKAQNACRLRQPEKVGPAREFVPLGHRGHTDRAKVFHPHNLNAAEAKAREASDPHGPAEQTNRPERGERHRH